jgi:short subunit dehydrogenase-like uncharacterized protein
MQGYTGKLASKYIVEHCATDLKWAVAGRSEQKLTVVVNELHRLNVNRKAAGIVVADSDDFDALSSMARSTRVVVSYAGPYAKSDDILLS